MFATDDKRILCENETGTRTSDLPSQPASYPRAPQYQHGNQTIQDPYHQVYCYPTQPLPHPPSVLPYNLDQVMVVPIINHRGYTPKSLPLAVILCIPILGLFGVHHFYLNNLLLGGLYCGTFGLFGIGWVVDWFRIPWLVKRCNEDLKEAHERGHWLFCTERFIGPLRKISLVDAYLMWLPPFGLFGIHHFYLGRTRYGVFQSFTMGLNVVGWTFDLLRMPWLVRKANEDVAKLKAGIKVDKPPYSLLDAYLLAVPLGIMGLHHFYLGNTRRGVLFLCTLGVFGLGWLADMFQMPLIVAEANKEKELRERLNGALTQQQNRTSTTNIIVVPAGDRYQSTPGYLIEPPPAYVSHNINREVVERSCAHAPPRPDISYQAEHTAQHVHLPRPSGYNDNSMAESAGDGKFVA